MGYVLDEVRLHALRCLGLVAGDGQFAVLAAQPSVGPQPVEQQQGEGGSDDAGSDGNVPRAGQPLFHLQFAHVEHGAQFVDLRTSILLVHRVGKLVGILVHLGRLFVLSQSLENLGPLFPDDEQRRLVVVVECQLQSFIAAFQGLGVVFLL